MVLRLQIVSQRMDASFCSAALDRFKFVTRPSSTKLFRPGFRISVLDVFFLVGLSFLSLTVWLFDAGLALLIFLPAGAFFLFCNVFRIRRVPELLWTLAYLPLAAWAYLSEIGLSAPILLLVGWAAALIGNDVRHPGYHGVFWKQWNPTLPEWFDQQFGKRNGQT
jgi:hypothetical protein